MEKRLVICSVFMAFFLFSSLAFYPLRAQPIQLMSFNIRFDNPGDGYDAWPHRRGMVRSMIRFHDIDLLGVQEALRAQLDDISELLPDYEWFGVCRTDGTTTPNPDNEFSAIFYRADRFERLDGATFWLSENPHEVGSRGWDAAFPRIVTWARFRRKASGEEFFLFNTHFDHMGRVARAESARLIQREIARIAGEAPVILMGDFNCTPEEEPYQIIIAPGVEPRLFDALHVSELPHHGPLATWSGFQFPGVPGRRIDFIFVDHNWRVSRHGILSDSWSGRFPSDHLPVLASVELN
jgi:endonuclease/exonuclease/phosphatase family metal-dependent hydrolase